MKDIEYFKKNLSRVVDIAVNDLMNHIGTENLKEADKDSMRSKSGWSPSGGNWGIITFKNPSKKRSVTDETPAKQTGNLVSKTSYNIKKHTMTYVVNTPYAKALELGHMLYSSYDKNKWFKGKKSNKFVEGRPYLSTIVMNSILDDKKIRYFKKSLKQSLRNAGF